MPDSAAAAVDSAFQDLAFVAQFAGESQGGGSLALALPIIPHEIFGADCCGCLNEVMGAIGISA